MKNNIPKELYSATGIYEIRNLVNGKTYIGSTSRLGRRFNDHLSSLNRQTHVNKRLQKAFYKYGVDAFSFNVLRKIEPLPCESIDALKIRVLQLEYEAISKAKATNPKYGYNIHLDPRQPPRKYVANKVNYPLPEPLKVKREPVTIEEVKQIKYLLMNGLSIRAINTFMNRTTAGGISRGETHSHLRLSQADISRFESIGLLQTITLFNQTRLSNSRKNSNDAGAKSARSRFSVLTIDEVCRIKILLDEGQYIAQIASKFDTISRTAIEKIRSGKTWSHITNIEKGKSTTYENSPAIGVRHRDAKLTEEQVRAIKLALSKGERISDIANRYPVKFNAIRAIKTGRSWRHIIV